MDPWKKLPRLDRMHCAVFCSALLFLSAGCLGLTASGGSQTPQDSPGQITTNQSAVTATIDAQNLTLERGEAGTLRVKATGISAMWVEDYPVGKAQMVVDDLAVDLGSDEVISRPNINAQADSYPPIWKWNEVESNVTVRIPIEPSENASLGQYSFEISAENDTGEVNDTATVRVTERNEN